MAKPKHWLMKSEPETYSIDDFKNEKTTWWEGVRNYQARNFMRDMKKGDLVLFYHSNANPPAIVGLATVSKEAQPDKSAFDKKSSYYDPKSTPENPRWFCVEIAFQKKFKKILPLEELKKEKSLKSMVLLKPGSRLSVQPVTPEEFAHILKMAEL